MINRINTSLECVTEKDNSLDTHRRFECRVSPSSHIFNQKIKCKGGEQKRLLRNVSDSSKNSARGQKTKRSESRDRDAEREESLKRKAGGEYNDMLRELVNLKGEYQTLKGSYSSLIKEKMAIGEQAKSKEKEIERLADENTRLKKEIDSYIYQINYLGSELDRIKKQSIKLLEHENYKAKKLEENIREKERIIASRNESSLSFCHEQITMTEAKDPLSLIQPIYSHRNLNSGFNTDMGDQKKMLFRRDHSTVEHTIEQPLPQPNPHRYRRNSSDSAINIQVNLCETTNEGKKKNPFETITNFKSENEKKKRSVTNVKLQSGKKKAGCNKTAFVKKKTNNDSLR